MQAEDHKCGHCGKHHGGGEHVSSDELVRRIAQHVEAVVVMANNAMNSGGALRGKELLHSSPEWVALENVVFSALVSSGDPFEVAQLIMRVMVKNKHVNHTVVLLGALQLAQIKKTEIETEELLKARAEARTPRTIFEVVLGYDPREKPDA